MPDKKKIGIWGRDPHEVHAHIEHIGLPLELWPDGDCLSAVAIRDQSFIESGVQGAFEIAKEKGGIVQVVALRRELEDLSRQP